MTNLSRKGTCEVEGCGRTIQARRLCSKHYMRERVFGDARHFVAATDLSFEDYFWSRVRRGDPGECWLWTGGTNAAGYGQVAVDGAPKTAHRVALELTLGRPLTLWALHTCDNPTCCNPAHLYEGTAQQNSSDRDKRGRSNRAAISRTRIERGVAKGERNPRAKITMEQAHEIRRRYQAGGISQASLGAEYGVDQTLVSLIVRNKIWTD